MAEALILGIIQKLESVLKCRFSKSVNMAEALILGLVQKLESAFVEMPSWDLRHDTMKDTINELRLILDFLRDLNSEERNSLKYFIDDLAEMAQDALDIIGETNDYNLMKDRFKKKRMRMINLRADHGGLTETRPQKDVREGDEEEVVVGLEEDVHQLLHRAILSEESGLFISCIKGMIGIGKTCLARQVYNHKAVVDRFKHRAWLCLSDGDKSNKEMLLELIRQLVVGTEELERDLLLEKMDNRSLRQMLRQHLQGMPYFIVFDSMHTEQMDSIFRDIRNAGYGSEGRLLFTSHHHISCDIIRVYYTHKMKILDSDKSWQLFLKTIFRGNKFTSDKHKFSKQLEKKGREMLKKCGGLPVAIIDVARQKAEQRLLGIEWEELFDSIDLGATLKLLEPMYHKLDEKFKPCFLHMSFFKENAIMRKEKLEHIWAAGRLLFGYENAVFMLENESIIEDVDDLLKRYRINPVLHMLSIQKAEEKMGFEIVRCNANNRPSQSPRHHRVVQCSRDKFNHSTNQNKHLVSLIFHGGGRYLDDASPSYWESFEILNILDLEDFGVKTLSEIIGTLVKLRYLGLRNNYIQKIPHSFTGLKELEVLDIAQNFMVEVPNIIWEMGSLRHLYMSDVICRKPLKIDALPDLETLTYISLDDWAYEVSGLEAMTCLKKLGIEELDENCDVSKLFTSLAKLIRLQSLTLRGFRFKSMPCLDDLGILDDLWALRLRLDGLLVRLPSANNFPQCIVRLILVNTCLDDDPMPVLEKLPSLFRLKLRNAYTGQQMVIHQCGFPVLEVLSINELWNLRNLQVGRGAMSKLEQLEMKNCPYLETLPEEIGSMAYLSKFKMVTTKHIATKIRKSSLISKIVEVDISP